MSETPLPHGARPQNDFDSQYRRVFEAAGCRTQVELAALLEVRQSSISDAKRRRSVPPEWLVKLFEKKQINPDWVRYGVEAKYLSPANAGQSLPHIVRVTEVRPPGECSAQELFNELVRRALQEPDIEAMRKAAADGCPPARGMREKS